MTLTTPPPGTLSEVTPDQMLSADSQDSIARYLTAGDQMARLMAATLKTCVGVAVLVVAAWVLGLLPAAVRLL
jgi:hypothetical protein